MYITKLLRTMQLIKDWKQIYDSIHKSIKISNYACLIIDTSEFQRLRYLHQLGTCFYAFPDATHTRFEHSVGTYHLAGEMVKNIVNNTTKATLNEYVSAIPELKDYFVRTYGLTNENDQLLLDNYVTELIKIAGLVHDLGHGPFSHVFDDVFIPIIRENQKQLGEALKGPKGGDEHPMELHENRSGSILEHIIKTDDVLRTIILDPEIQFIKNLINPQPEHKGFVYQIVSNNLNSIDVDKFDYMSRDTTCLGLKFGFDSSRLINDAKVISNIICFPKQIYYEVASIFTTRYRLHKQIYGHKAVISTQMMINDMMILIDPIVGIYNKIFDVASFCTLTDSYIIETVKFLYETRSKYGEYKRGLIEQAYTIWNNINRRNFYKFIGSIVSVTPLSIMQFDKLMDGRIVIHKAKIGYVSGKKGNPFDNLYFYSSKMPDKMEKMVKEDTTYLFSNVYQEYVYMVFVKDRSDQQFVDHVTHIFKNVQTVVKNQQQDVGPHSFISNGPIDLEL